MRRRGKIYATWWCCPARLLAASPFPQGGAVNNASRERFCKPNQPFQCVDRPFTLYFNVFPFCKECAHILAYPLKHSIRCLPRKCSNFLLIAVLNTSILKSAATPPTDIFGGGRAFLAQGVFRPLQNRQRCAVIRFFDFRNQNVNSFSELTQSFAPLPTNGQKMIEQPARRHPSGAPKRKLSWCEFHVLLISGIGSLNQQQSGRTTPDMVNEGFCPHGAKITIPKK